MTGLHGLFLFLTLFGFMIWYRPPYMCNPCTWPPTAVTGELLFEKSIEANVYFGSRGRWVTVYPTGVEEWGYGTAYSVSEIPQLIVTAAEHHPDFPVVIKAEQEAPSGLVLHVLHHLQMNGFRNVFFEAQNPR